MGASKEKMNRAAGRGNELSPKERAAQQAAAEKKKTNTRFTVGVVIVLIVALLAGVVNSSLFDTRLTAAKTGDSSWSLAQVRYAKQTAYTQFRNNYSGLVDYLIDKDTPLDEQTCSFDSSMTWDEYFTEQGLSYLQELSAYYDLAKAEGYTLSEEDQKNIDDNIALFGTYANLYGYTTDGYLAAMYGEGNSEKTVRAFMEMSTLAGNYAQDKQDAFTESYSDEQLDAWFTEHANDYNKVSYLTAFIAAEADEEGNVSEEAMAAARETAQAVLDKCEGTTESFSAAVLEVTGEEAAESSSVLGVMSDSGEWATAARKVGDTTMMDESTGCRLYCFLELDENDYNTVNVRHILMEAHDADGDGTVSEEEKQAAFEEITAIRDEWDGTEEGFAELANKYSEDPGSNTNGGLYENITKGQMVPEFDEFCFADHKSGDTDIVYNENYGYFFIYFVGEGESYHHALARDTMTGEDFTAWKDELLVNYPITKTALFKKV